MRIRADLLCDGEPYGAGGGACYETDAIVLHFDNDEPRIVEGFELPAGWTRKKRFPAALTCIGYLCPTCSAR